MASIQEQSYQAEKAALTGGGPVLHSHASYRKKWRKSLLVARFTTILLNQKKQFVPHPLSFAEGSKALLFGNRLNILLAFVPLAIASAVTGGSDALVFSLSCIGLLPLANLLGDATEKVAHHTNDTVGGLLNASFGNATELIVSVFALNNGLIQVVQVSLLGSILSNLLLVMGCSFITAGIRWKLVKFNTLATSSNMSLLLLACLSIIIPGMLESLHDISDANELHLSRLIAVLLLVIYMVFVYFQLVSHHSLFEEEEEEEKEEESGATKEDEDDEEEAILTMPCALFWLAIITVLVAVLSEYLTGAIEGAAEGFSMSEGLIGFVILPIVGNAAEHATALVMSYRGKMDLALSVALGSSTQIALFVIPAMVIYGWCIGQPMSLMFGAFESAVTFLSVIISAVVVNNGQSHYLHGVLLVTAYVIIAMSFSLRD